jgi:hypothetical protein
MPILKFICKKGGKSLRLILLWHKEHLIFPVHITELKDEN